MTSCCIDFDHHSESKRVIEVKYPVPTSSTMQLKPLTDITGSNLSDACSFLWSHKKIHNRLAYVL